MDNKEIINSFKHYRPINRKQIKDLGLSLWKLGYGLFRKTYKIRDSNLIVKFPSDHSCDLEEGIQHAVEEFDKIQNIKKSRKLFPFRRYLPEILYFDRQNGVTITPEYFHYPSSKAEEISRILSYLATDLGRDSGGDIHSSNVLYKLDEYNDRVPVLVDLGYF